jgi:hypothetical protein
LESVFRVGDTVKVIARPTVNKIGDIGKITEQDDGVYRVTVQGRKNESNWQTGLDLAHINPDLDVPKPVFKIGDIVKVIADNGPCQCNEDTIGHIGEIVFINNYGFPIELEGTDVSFRSDELELYTSASTTDEEIAKIELQLIALKKARAEELKAAKPVHSFEYEKSVFDGEHFYKNGGRYVFGTTSIKEITDSLNDGADVTVFKCYNDSDCPEGYKFDIDVGTSHDDAIEIRLVKQ